MKKIRLLACLLALCLCVSLMATGCGDNTGTEVAMTIDGVEIPAGLYVGYMLNAYSEAMSNYNAATVEEGEEKADFWDYTVSDMSIEEYIKETALGYCKDYVAIEQKFNELGLTLTDEDNTTISNTVSNALASYEDFYIKNGCGEQSLKKMAAVSVKAQRIFYYYYGEDGEEPVTDSEIIDYYRENYFEIRYMSFSFTGSDGTAVSEEDRETYKSLAEQYVQRANAGENFSELLTEQIQWQIDTRGLEYDIDSFDPETSYNIYNKSTSGLSDNLINTVFDLELGKAAMVEESTGIIVFQRTDVMRDESNFEENRDSLLYSLKESDYENKVDNWAANLTYEFNDRAIERYSPKNIQAYETASTSASA